MGDSNSEPSLTGCKLADLEILTVAPHETFISLLLTSKKLNQLATGPCRNQLYEARVRCHLPHSVCIVGIFPQDENNKWKEVYDSLMTFEHNPLIPYLSGSGILFPSDENFFNVLRLQLKDEKFYQILALNELSKMHSFYIHAGSRSLIEVIMIDLHLDAPIYRNGAFRLLKWIDSLGLLRIPNNSVAHIQAIRLVAESGNLEMLKWMIVEKGYGLEVVDQDNTLIANIAAWKGHTHVLDWLKEQGIIPDYRGIEYILTDIRNLTYRVLDAGDLPKEAQQQLMSAKVYKILEWMEEAGIDTTFVRQLQTRNWYELLRL